MDLSGHRPGTAVATSLIEGTNDGLLESLNDEQREAVAYCHGPLRVIAGAGTGKTRVITARFAHLVEAHAVPAEQILALTFSRKAADEMRARIVGSLSTGYRKLWVHTFHSFCLRILRDIHESSPDSPELMVLSEIDRRTLTAHAVDSVEEGREYYAGPKGRQQLIEDSLTLVARAKDYLVSPDAFEAYAAPRRSPRLDELARVYREYQRRMEAAGALDFAEIGYRVVRLLESDGSLRARYAARFQHVIVDEFQDTNEGQYRLLTLLVPPDGNLCVVGDPNQSIYAFRGAALEYMRDLEKHFPTIRTVALPRNYRSHQRILDAANALISRDSEQGGLVSHTGEQGERVVIAELSTEEAEARHIASTILALRQAGRRYNECAILCRSVKTSGPALAAALAALDIPYQMGGLAAADYATIEDLLAALRLALGERGWPDLRRLLAGRGVPGLALRSLDARLRSLGTAVDSLDAASLPPDEAECVRTAEEIAAYLSSLHGQPLDRLLYQVLLYTGHLSDELRPNQVELIRSLLSEAAAAQAARWDLGMLIEHLRESFGTNEDEPPGQGPGVAVLTVHAAKGLEWPVVFVTGLADTRFPLPMRLGRTFDLDEICSEHSTGGYQIPKSEAEREVRYRDEERRLCYVALTRARERLYLTRARAYDRDILPPSPFIEEVAGLQDCVQVARPREEPATIAELACQLHSRMMKALDVPVSSPNVAGHISDVLTGEWAGWRIPGAVPLRLRRLPAPNFTGCRLQLSYSQLDRYEACPRQYLYSGVLRLSRETDAPYAHNGSAVHRVLQRLNSEWERTGSVPAEERVRNEVEQVFGAGGFGSPGLLRQARERALAQLLRYYAHERSAGRVPIAVEHRFSLPYDSHTFIGSIDCVMRLPDGSVELIDYKTGRGDDLKPKESLQLFIYEMYWRSRQPDTRTSVAYYLLKHAADKGRQYGAAWDARKQVKEWRHTEQTQQALRARIDGLLDRIVNNEFEAGPERKLELCRDCAYSFLCPESLA